MSPFGDVTTIEMSPNLEVSTGGQIGKDRNEQQGITTGRGLGASGKRRTETSQRRGDDGDELSAEQTLGPALSRRGRARAAGGSGACTASGESGKSMWGSWCRW